MLVIYYIGQNVIAVVINWTSAKLAFTLKLVSALKAAILLSHHIRIDHVLLSLYFCIHLLYLVLMKSMCLHFLSKFKHAWCLAAINWSWWFKRFLIFSFFYHIGMTHSNTFGPSSSFHVHWRRNLSLRCISLHLRIFRPVDGAHLLALHKFPVVGEAVLWHLQYLL